MSDNDSKKMKAPAVRSPKKLFDGGRLIYFYDSGATKAVQIADTRDDSAYLDQDSNLVMIDDELNERVVANVRVLTADDVLHSQLKLGKNTYIVTGHNRDHVEFLSGNVYARLKQHERGKERAPRKVKRVDRGREEQEIVARQGALPETPSPRIELPPGSRMLSIGAVAFFFSSEARERVVDQAVADYREEYYAALKVGDRSEILKTHLRHWGGFVWAVGMELAVAALKIIKVVKGAG